VKDTRAMLIWKSPVPLKVKIFFWMAMHDRIQCGVRLKKKKWSGPEKYFVCDQFETSDHILFQCPLAIFLWTFFRECLGCDVVATSCLSLFLEIVEKSRGKKQMLIIFLSAGALWSLWKSRNNLVFNEKVMASPVVLIHKMLMLIKSWRPLLKTKMKPTADDMMNLISA